MIVREERTIVPDGNTRVLAGDLLVFAAHPFEDRENLFLHEVGVERGSRWANRSLSQVSLPNGQLVILVKRGMETIIPTGSTVLLPGDVLVLAESVSNTSGT